MKRGEVFECRLAPVEGTEQGGTRPAVVVSHDGMNAVLDRAIVVPLTTHRGRTLYPSHVLIRAPAGGLSRDSVALCDQVRVAAVSRLLRSRGSLPPPVMAAIDRALAASLGLPMEPPAGDGL